MKENFILIDYCSFTSKIDNLWDMLDFLKLSEIPFTELPGVRGWRYRLHYDEINISYGDRDEIWVEMTGQGCRAFETYGSGDWAAVFDLIRSDPKAYNITRLDIAFDDHTGLLDLSRIIKDTRAENYVSRIEDWHIYEGRRSGETLYLGSEGSEQMIRIYDKAKERGREEEGHWIRLELELHDEYARTFLDLLILRTIGEAFSGVVNHYIRFVQPSADSNKRRWPTRKYWKKLVETSERFSLWRSPGVDYNILKLERYVVDQAGAAAAALIEIKGEQAVLDLMRGRLAQSVNPKYKNLIGKHKQDSQELIAPHSNVVAFLGLTEFNLTCSCCSLVAPSSEFVSYQIKTKKGLCRKCYHSGEALYV